MQDVVQAADLKVVRLRGDRRPDAHQLVEVTHEAPKAVGMNVARARGAVLRARHETAMTVVVSRKAGTTRHEKAVRKDLVRKSGGLRDQDAPASARAATLVRALAEVHQAVIEDQAAAGEDQAGSGGGRPWI
jgi:hypothetical protein